MKVIRSTRLIVLCLWVCSSLKGGIHAQVASGPTAAGGGGDLRPPRQQSSTSDFVYVASAGSWSTAEAGCVERGGHLASITSAAGKPYSCSSYLSSYTVCSALHVRLPCVHRAPSIGLMLMTTCSSCLLMQMQGLLYEHSTLVLVRPSDQ